MVEDMQKVLDEFQVYYEKRLQEEQIQFENMVENFNAYKRITKYLVELLKKCNCKVINPQALAKLIAELNAIDDKVIADVQQNQENQTQHAQQVQQMQSQQNIMLGGGTVNGQQVIMGQNGEMFKIDANGNKVKLSQTEISEVQNNQIKRGLPAGMFAKLKKNQENTGEESNPEQKRRNNRILDDDSQNNQQNNEGSPRRKSQLNLQSDLMIQIQPVLPQGVKLLLDKNGKPALDKNGNPVFLDKTGKPVKLSQEEIKQYKQSLQQIEVQNKILENLKNGASSGGVMQIVIQKEETKQFIFKDGKKIEVFTNDKGQIVQIDASGKEVIVSKKDLLSLKTETKIVDVVQNYILDDSGQQVLVQIDKSGKPFYQDKNGNIVQIDKEKLYENKLNVQVDKNGNQFIIDPLTGSKKMVMINENGEQFVLNEKGQPQLINQPQQPKVQTDINGNKFIVGENGEQLQVFLNEFGVECIKDKRGFVIPVKQVGRDKDIDEILQQIYENENGEKFILGQNGEQMIIKTDENGNTYFEGKNGEKQLISQKAMESYAKQAQSGVQPLIMNSKGEIFVKDKSGKLQKVEVNQFGEKFIVNEDGTKVQINKVVGQTPKFEIQKGENGEQFIIDKKGNKLQVKIDKNGNSYVVGEKGEKVIINSKVNPFGLQQKAHNLHKKLQNAEILTDENGNKFIYDKKGQKQQVEIGKNGKPFYRDENGNVQMVFDQDQRKVIVDDNGNQFVLINGQQQKVKVNEKGEKFFINEDGEVQIIRDPESESESEDEPLPDYVDESGNCKHCGHKYVPKTIKHKGGCYSDEKGERYVLDKNGNKVYLQTNPDGQLFYMDADGKMVIIGKHAKFRKQNWLNGSDQRQNATNEDNAFANYARRFATDDKEIIEKVMQLDDQTLNLLISQFESPVYLEIKEKIKVAKLDTGQILEIYELLRIIGANFKMSDNEFLAKIQIFKKSHIKCSEECIHIDPFLKRMFVQNQMVKALKRMKRISVQKLSTRKMNRLQEQNLDQTQNQSRDNSK